MSVAIDLYDRARKQGWIGMGVGTGIAFFIPFIYFPIGLIGTVVGFARGFALWRESRSHQLRWRASQGKALMLWSVLGPVGAICLWVGLFLLNKIP